LIVNGYIGWRYEQRVEFEVNLIFIAKELRLGFRLGSGYVLLG